MNPGPSRAQALLEVGLCSGLPTQILISAGLALGGVRGGPGGEVTLGLLASVGLIDTVLLVGLVTTLLTLGGESPRAVIFGQRPVAREIVQGFLLVPWVFVLVALAAFAILTWAPGLVTPNPLASLASTRGEYVLFAITVILAGGVREEIQRAFILHRSEQRLGGAMVGVIGFGLVFGLGHYLQGWSAVIVTTLLGLLWSLVYLARRSAIAPMVSHASFNLVEVIAFGQLA